MSKGTTRTVRDDVLEIIEKLPGVTLKDIAELLPTERRTTISAILTTLHATGDVLRELSKEPANSFGRKPYVYKLNPDPKPPVVKEPSAVAFKARIAELEAKVHELTLWKADAINRFPDLGVDPITAEARKIVAAELDKTDPAMAQQVRAGLKDGILPMRVTIAALQR